MHIFCRAKSAIKRNYIVALNAPFRGLKNAPFLASKKCHKRDLYSCTK